jgi:hypothetical protein
MRKVEGPQRRHDQRGNTGQRRDDERARKLPGLAATAPFKIGEHFVGAAGHLEHVAPRIRQRIAPRVALEKRRSERTLQRFHMAVHGGPVHTKRFGCRAHGAHSGDHQGGSQFDPMLHDTCYRGNDVASTRRIRASRWLVRDQPTGHHPPRPTRETAAQAARPLFINQGSSRCMSET